MKFNLRGSATEAQFGSKEVIEKMSLASKSDPKASSKVIQLDLKTDPKVISKASSKVTPECPQK